MMMTTRSNFTGWRLRVLALAGAVTAFAGFAAADDLEGSIQIKGSDTMVNLCQAWAEGFMIQHPKVTVAVTGGGSGTGIAAFIAGTCDLAAVSRRMTDKEIASASSQGRAVKEWTVALDGLAVVVHPENPVKRLTLRQLAEVFTGQIRNWRELGGADQGVVLLSREVNSGTHVYFKEHVLGSSQEFAPEALLLPSSQAIADEVATNQAGIGYYGMGYLNPKNAVVAVAKVATEPYVAPSEQTVRDGTYPISRPLFLYSTREPSVLAKAFLDFTLSAQGQAIVQQIDFVPVGERR